MIRCAATPTATSKDYAER